MRADRRGWDMRYSRIKPEAGAESFMHVYNRTVGSTSDRPFGEAEREEFIRRLRKLHDLYAIDVIAYQVMGNHYHILCHVPAEPPSNKEAAARYARFHDGKRTLSPDSPACTELALKLRDISYFIKDLQQPFTRWFNRTRSRRRRGHLWAERFKNTILEDGLAVWQCWQYVEMNPVRAGLAGTPAAYRFGSFGKWCGAGRHPFDEDIQRCLMSRLAGLLHIETMEDLRTDLRKAFARHTAVDRGLPVAQVDAAIAVAAGKETFTLRLDRRVRFWVDGLVIGSELFVRDVIGKVRPQYNIAKRRFVRAVATNPPTHSAPALCCFKQLRVLLE